MSENLSKIIPYVHVDNSHFITRDGRAGTVIECSGRNIRVLSEDEADALTTSYGAVLNRLPEDARLQMIATNHPLDAHEWVPAYMRQFDDCPPHLHRIRADYEKRLHEKLEGSHLPMLRYYVVLTTKLPAKRGIRHRSMRGLFLKRSPHLYLSRQDHDSYTRRLLSSTEALARMLENELGVRTRQLLQGEMLELFQSCLSPHWHSVHKATPETVGDGLARATVRGDDRRKLLTLHEALGQGALDRYQDHIALDTLRVRTLSLTDYPESTRPGWLRNLMSLPVRWRLVIDITPLDPSREMAHLKRQLRMQTADNAPLDPSESHNELARVMKLISFDPENVYRQAEMESFIELLSTTDQKPFRVAAHIAVTSESRKQLDRDTKLVIDSLSTDGSAIVDKRVIDQLPAWLCTLPGVVTPDSWRTPTRNLGDTFPMLHNHAGTPEGMLIGWSDPGGEAVLFDPHSPHMPNALMTTSGRSAAGKTMFAQTTALHTALRGYPSIVFDHSDTAHWRDLATTLGGKHFFVSTDGEISINPLQLKPADLEIYRKTGRVPSAHSTWLVQLLGLMAGDGGRLTKHEIALADEAIQRLYASAPHPHMSDLRDALAASSDPVARGMALDLAPYTGNGLYGPFLDRDTNLDDSALITVFNFSRCNADLTEVAVALLFDHTLERLRVSRRRALLVLDEGWSFLEHDIMARHINSIGRKARHTTAAVLAITQNIEDFAHSPAGRSIVDNASANFLLAHSPNILPSLRHLFSLTEAEEQTIASFNQVPTAFENSEFGSPCWLHSKSAGVERGRVRLWVTPEEYWLATSAAQVRDEISARRLAAEELGDIYDACRQLAAQAAAPRTVTQGVR